MAVQNEALAQQVISQSKIKKKLKLSRTAKQI
jgi:hypothetical protein